MNLESILTILKKIIDICLVWVVFYYVLKNIRKNVKSSNAKCFTVESKNRKMNAVI